MTKSSKLIYRTFGVYTFIKNLLLRIIVLGIAAACFYNFKENPIVTAIAGTLSLIAFLIIGDDELVVYSDRIKYYTDSILKRYMSHKQFLLTDIESFEVKGMFGFKFDVITDNAPLHLPEPYNNIRVVLNDGTITEVHTRIYIDKLKKACEIVNSLIKDKK